MNSIHLVISLVASQEWSVYYMDVKSTFLHGDLHEEIYMEQPPSFLQDSSLVCRLQHSLYGLKQAPRAWYEKMDSFMITLGFNHCHYDPMFYTRRRSTNLLILVLYVDNLILTGISSSIIQSVQQALMETL
jgi:hypothetical protein